jgi:hypothetical protein
LEDEAAVDAATPTAAAIGKRYTGAQGAKVANVFHRIFVFG